MVRMGWRYCGVSARQARIVKVSGLHLFLCVPFLWIVTSRCGGLFFSLSSAL